MRVRDAFVTASDEGAAVEVAVTEAVSEVGADADGSEMDVEVVSSVLRFLFRRWSGVGLLSSLWFLF